MSEIKFVDGLRVWPPHERAPDFVKGAMTVNVPELKAWLEQQRESQIRVDIKVSKGGKWYLAVNDYKPQGGTNTGASAPPPPADDFDQDIPF